jgi:UDP-N-acetylmuramate--alanine ligase
MVKNFSQHIAMLGIGGIGMSALAQYLIDAGHTISGYDRSANPQTEQLSRKGATMVLNIADFQFSEDVRTVIYTPALGESHPLLELARSRGLELIKRSAALGQIARGYRSIAIGGTHGKTTVASMLTCLLNECCIDTTGIVGGVMTNYNSNFYKASGDLLVVEADEFDHSFLQLHPLVGVINSTEADHLDVYNDAETLLASYRQFAQQVDPNGLLLVHAPEKHHFQNIPGVKTFGLEKGADYYSVIRSQEGLSTYFDFHGPLGIQEGLLLNMAGAHNVLNMTAAIAVAQYLHAAPATVSQAIRTYRGVRRRFEARYHTKELVIIDDYAHHPTEIDVAIATARACFPTHQLIVAFQPHLYSRTRDFAAGFGASLSQADVLFLTHIYAAREEPIAGVSCETIMNHVKSGLHKDAVNLSELADRIVQSIRKPATILVLGAGDIDSIIPGLQAKLVR